MTVKASAGLTKVTVTASLYQSHAPWLTSVFMTLDLAGLDHDFRPVGGPATLAVGQAAVPSERNGYTTTAVCRRVA